MRKLAKNNFGADNERNSLSEEKKSRTSENIIVGLGRLHHIVFVSIVSKNHTPVVRATYYYGNLKSGSCQLIDFPKQ